MKFLPNAATIAALLFSAPVAVADTDQNPPVVTATQDGVVLFPEYGNSESFDLPENLDLNEGPNLPSIPPMQLETEFDAKPEYVPLLVAPVSQDPVGGGGCGKVQLGTDFSDSLQVYPC